MQEQEDEEDVELLIGVFETEEEARAAIERGKQKPGFVDFPEGFQIHPTECRRLDRRVHQRLNARALLA